MEFTDDVVTAERQSGFFDGEQRRNIFATATTTRCYLLDIPVQEVLMDTMTSTAELLALFQVLASPLVIMWPTTQCNSANQPTNYKRLA